MTALRRPYLFVRDSSCVFVDHMFRRRERSTKPHELRVFPNLALIE